MLLAIVITAIVVLTLVWLYSMLETLAALTDEEAKQYSDQSTVVGIILLFLLIVVLPAL